MKRFRELSAHVRTAVGLWRCSRGHHERPLEWLPAGRRPVPITNQPLEMMNATGFIARFAKWNGWCRRCGAAVQWSAQRPTKREMAA